MALTVTSGLTEWDDCDTANWTGDPTVGVDTDILIEGTGSIGVDVDIETIRIFGAAKTSTSLSNNFIYAWLLSYSASDLDTTANGGMQLCVEDGSGNQSCWYVGGADNYAGGWEVFSCSTAETPDWNNGTAASLGSIVKFGVGFKNTAKSKLSDNCFVDWMRYGTVPALTISGTNTTANAGWSEVLTQDEAGVYGIIKGQKGGYVLKGPVQIGDSAGTATTDFTDTGTTLVFDGLPVGTGHYKITIAGNSTGTTDVQLGSVVGTGDDRQGTRGNIISVAPIPSGSHTDPAWSWDSQTDIADIDTVQLYGCIFRGGKGGLLFDGKSTAANSSIISCSFINCGAVETGAASNGVEILNSFFIDPEGNTNNYGLQFDQTPSVGTMSTNIKKCSFITSGTPTTQYMVVFPYAGDYTVGFEDMQVFGSFTSGTLWHGLNSGTDADVTVNATGSTNFATAEFSSTDVTGPDTGSVTVQASVDVKITIVDQNGSPIQNVQTAVYLTADDSNVFNLDTNASGLASGTFSGTTPANCYIRWRKSSTGTTRYIADSSTGTIQSGSGLEAQFVMKTDNIASS